MPQISPINWIFTISLLILVIIMFKETLNPIKDTFQVSKTKTKTMKPMKW